MAQLEVELKKLQYAFNFGDVDYRKLLEMEYLSGDGDSDLLFPCYQDEAWCNTAQTQLDELLKLVRPIDPSSNACAQSDPVKDKQYLFTDEQTPAPRPVLRITPRL